MLAYSNSLIMMHALNQISVLISIYINLQSISASCHNGLDATNIIWL